MPYCRIAGLLYGNKKLAGGQVQTSIDQETERERLTREALAEVDVGLVIVHEEVHNWADSRGNANPQPASTMLAHIWAVQSVIDGHTPEFRRLHVDVRPAQIWEMHLPHFLYLQFRHLQESHVPYLTTASRDAG